ncbi:MAG: sensor histidine kinase [Evtepia sp.]
MDALMEGKGFPAVQTYEDSVTAKVQGKLLQYYEKMADGQRQSTEDKQTIQELVSDISHQVKTPLANLQMFLGILRQHPLSSEKREEFLALMAGQVDKLEFLLASLIKMSRLETGTFALHLEESLLSETWPGHGYRLGQGEAKGIALAIHCDDTITVCHDPKCRSPGEHLGQRREVYPAGDR